MTAKIMDSALIGKLRKNIAAKSMARATTHFVGGAAHSHHDQHASHIELSLTAVGRSSVAVVNESSRFFYVLLGPARTDINRRS